MYTKARLSSQHMDRGGNTTDNNFEKELVIREEMGKESSEPMAWNLGEMSSAGRGKSNDHELGSHSHSKNPLYAEAGLRTGKWTSVSMRLVLRTLNGSQRDRKV